MGGSVRSLVVIAALWLAACGSGGSGASATGPAGTVVELTGEATAVRAAPGSTPRSLATGATVYADDTVTTADEAAITIELAHNGARWSLTGGVSRRVDRSPAWRAAKSGGDSLLSATERDRTAAAGRHAERSAAETTAPAPVEATAREAEEEMVDDEPEAAADVMPMAERMPAPTAAPAPEPEPEPEPTPEPPSALPPPPPPPPAPDPEPPRRTATKSERAKRSPSGDGAVDSMTRGLRPPADDELAPGTGASARLTREQILRTVSTMRKALAQCAADHDGKGKTVKVAFVVAPDGRPRSARAQSPHADTPLGRCVEATVERTRFPKATQDTTVTFPFRL